MPEASVKAPTFGGNRPNPKPAFLPWDEPVTRKYRSFLGAFLDELDRLASENYFAQTVGNQCSDGYECSWYPAAIQRRIALYDYNLIWPLSTDDLRHVSDAEILKYVEFFYRLVSRPLDEWEHRHCGESHPRSYDEQEGKQEYAKRVGALFKTWNPELSLLNGDVVDAGSKVLSPRLADGLDYGDDSHLQVLVEASIRKFRSPILADRLSSLTDIANALERVKTSLAGDKKQSVKLLTALLSPSPDLVSSIDSLLAALTALSNGLTIRHHEMTKIQIGEQDELIEFLYYSYYNMVRYALSQINRQVDSTDQVAVAITFSK